MSNSMRIILSIKYDYVRVLTNSISLQTLTGQFQLIGANSSASHQSSMPSAYKDNELYIKVIVATRSVLPVVLNELLSDDNPKHILIRVCCRILNSAVTMWKASG